MDRIEFLKKGLLGTGLFLATRSIANVTENNIDELKELEVLGFNHLPLINSKIMENTINCPVYIISYLTSLQHNFANSV